MKILKKHFRRTRPVLIFPEKKNWGWSDLGANMCNDVKCIAKEITPWDSLVYIVCRLHMQTKQGSEIDD